MTLTNLLLALIQVESSGLLFPPRGDGGRAIGPLQIHRSVVADVNRIQGWSFRWEQMADRELAKLVAAAYLRHWGKKIPHRAATVEDLARIWNGGPDGWRDPATVPYWHKVKRVLVRQRKIRGRKRAVVLAAVPVQGMLPEHLLMMKETT